MMGDEEKILLKQDREYHFSESIVPKQTYQQVADETSLETDAKSLDGKSTRFKTLTSNRANLLAFLRTGGLRLYAYLMQQMHSVHSFRDLWRFKTVKVFFVLLSVCVLYSAMRLWEHYQNQATLNKYDQAANELTTASLTTRDHTQSRQSSVAAETEIAGALPTAAQAKTQVPERVAALEQAVEHSLTTLNNLASDNATNKEHLDELSRYTLEMVNIWQQAIKTQRAAWRRRNELGYTVYSINAQRAYLRNKRGELTSVRVGNILPGYGKILKLDARRGKVITESVVINWGVNDY